MIRCWLVLRNVVRHRPLPLAETPARYHRRIFRQKLAKVAFKTTFVCTVIGAGAGGVLWMQPGAGAETEAAVPQAGQYATPAAELQLGGDVVRTAGSIPAIGAPTPIPEPSTLALFGAALVGLMVVRKWVR